MTRYSIPEDYDVIEDVETDEFYIKAGLKARYHDKVSIPKTIYDRLAA